MDERTKTKFTRREMLRFILPSSVGIIIFLLPVMWEGTVTIPIGIITNYISELIEPLSKILVLVFILISAVVTAITSIWKPRYIMDNERLSKLFVCTPFYAVFRAVGAAVVVMVYTQRGPEWIISADTGGTMISLCCTLISWFFAASFLIPFLMDYGIMEYIGTLVRNFTQPLFRLPGRSTVDLLASWVGSNNVGVVITISQYEQGYYSAREAVTIASCFSAVSLPFCLVIAAMFKVDSLFVPFYVILTITGIISSIIMIRIPPLTRYPKEYYPPVGKKVNEMTPEGVSKHQWALQLAVEKAAHGPKITGILAKGMDMFLGIIFQSAPIVMAFGTIACIIAIYTPVVNVLSIPFGYYLNLFGIEEAFAAAPATIIGFVDMFLPAVLAANIVSFKTRFIVGILSLVQIIYMTEVGTLMLASKLPVKFKGLLAIFLEKTIIALPIIVLLTNLFGIA